MDPFATNHTVGSHPSLPPLRPTNRRTGEHVGPCPFCGGDPRRSDRFHVWFEPGRERFWCRACDAKGPLSKLLGDERPAERPRGTPQRRRGAHAPQPDAAHQDAYRELYERVALWAYALLLDDCNPDPLAYLHGRGLNKATIERNLLGATLRDPGALVAMLGQEAPHLLRCGEEAGVLVRDYTGALRTHPNLCGALLFPYMAEGKIVDLRARSFPGKGYRSLPGGYSERGAVYPFGWEELGQTDTILITEGEIKALAVSQAYHDGLFDAPALAHPGLNYFREEWPAMLRAKGVRSVVLAYDTQVRPINDGVLALASEETWTLRNGQRLLEGGLEVRVLRLPLEQNKEKADLDAFLLSHRPHRLQHLLDLAPSLHDYQRSLPRALLQAAKITLPSAYPLRRSRPQLLLSECGRQEAEGRRQEAADTRTASYLLPTTGCHPPAQPLTLPEARDEIATLARDHAVSGEGFLVLAHPPGTGKGHNTAAGLQAYLRTHEAPGAIVWTGLRKEQIHDQEGIALTLLHGRNEANCRKIAEAQALASRGYSVRSALCQRRCPFVNSCRYLAQFGQEADFFASQDLLQATGWWQEAGVLVLDEFDPARLVRTVALDSANLAGMSAATPCPHARTLLGWLGALLGATIDRTVAGTLLLGELEALARADGLELGRTLRAAREALPDEEEVHMLPGLPQGAGVEQFAALPPNYLPRIVQLLDEEYRKRVAALPFTSRLEAADGRLLLFLRLDHVIDQLARPEQPKLILDATANEELLRAVFPDTPLRFERPTIVGSTKVIQVISRDWAKSTLRGTRLVRWYDEVAAYIRRSRPTLVVCTQAHQEGLQAALRERGYTNVVVTHYGAVRGSNAYKGYDVLLAQIYHPNLDAIIREGRALFAGQGAPLDERMVPTDTLLTDATGARWVVQVPTFADERLAALLAHHREAELVQAALRGRPLDHPEVQITMLFGLPLDSLPPTEIREGTTSPESNTGRQEQAQERLIAATQQLLDAGEQVVSVEDLIQATGQSPATVRKHLAVVAGRMRLRLAQQRRVMTLQKGGERVYTRAVLLRRGRRVPPPSEQTARGDGAGEGQGGGIDQARNKASITCLIYASTPARRKRSPANRPKGGRRYRSRRGTRALQRTARRQ